MAKRLPRGRQPDRCGPPRVTYQRVETGETWANDNGTPMPNWLKMFYIRGEPRVVTRED